MVCTIVFWNLDHHIYQVCQQFQSLQTGGGRVLAHGRPKVNTPKELVSRLTALAPASFFSTTPLPTHDSSAHQNTTVLCTICTGILDRPIELGCGTVACLLCITRWLTIKAELDADSEVECPCCENPLHDHAKAPSTVTMEVLGGQEVICFKGCNRAVKADHYMAHIQSQCQNYSSHSVLSPSRTTLGEVLDKDIDKPATHTEKKVAQNIIARMMAEGESSKILQLPTRGQVHK